VRPPYGSAKAIGISLGSVQRIWRAHQLHPHRLRTFKRSRDPKLCHQADRHRRARRHPSAHAVVLLLRRKSQIQALDRARPGLPIKPTAGKGLWGDFWNIRSRSTHPRLRNKGFERCRIGVPAAAGQMEREAGR